MSGLYQYENGLSKAVESNFKEKEWLFNPHTREWINDRIQI